MSVEVKLIERAARALRETPGAGAVDLAVAAWLDAAAEAFEIDHTEPPRNPRDRKMIYRSVSVARAVLGEPVGWD